MRVGLLIYGSLNTVSGGYLYDRMLVDTLRRHGDEVEIISLPWRTYTAHLTDNLSLTLARRLQRLRVDVLLQDELNHPSLFWVNRRLRPLRYPIVSIVHHLRCSEQRPAWRNAVVREIERIYLHNVDGFVFNSQTTAASVRRLLAHRSADSRIGHGADAVERVVARAMLRRQQPARMRLSNALDFSVVAYPAGNRFGPAIGEADLIARAKRPGPLQLLFVGNIIPRKGLHTLIDALAQLPRALWQLDVVGNLQVDLGYTQQIRRKLDLLELAGQVKLLGTLSDTALSGLLANSHALVVPSSYEGFGIVYLEAMGFGLPAIASTSGAAGEIITDGENGFLTPPDNADHLAQRLKLLCLDRDLVLRMGLAARQRYLAHPTWEDSMTHVRQMLERIAACWPVINSQSARHKRHV